MAAQCLKPTAALPLLSLPPPWPADQVYMSILDDLGTPDGLSLDPDDFTDDLARRLEEEPVASELSSGWTTAPEPS